MKKFILLCLVLCFYGYASAQTSHYHVTGTAEGTVDGDTIYLAVMTGFFQLAPTDTAIVKNGTFAFEGTIDGADLRVAVSTHKGKTIGITDFVLENAPITLQIFPHDSKKKPVIKGGEAQKLYNEISKEDEILAKEMAGPYNILNDSTQTQEEKGKAKAQLDSLRKVNTANHYNFIMKHIPSPISDMLLQWYAQDMTEEQLNTILDKMSAAKIQYTVSKLQANNGGATGSKSHGYRTTLYRCHTERYRRQDGHTALRLCEQKPIHPPRLLGQLVWTMPRRDA